MTGDLPLAADFPAAGRDDWLKLVRDALKGAPYERLVARTYDAIPIEPLYARAPDAQPVAGRRGPWQVVQRVDDPDPARAGAEARHALENGATGLALIFADSIGAHGFGLPPDATSIARALEGVRFDAAAIALETGEASKEAAEHVAELVRARGLAPGAVNIRFGHDPIGAHALRGRSPLSWRDLAPRFAAHAAGLVSEGFRAPVAAADGRLIHNAGGSEAQELAYVLAVALAYLRALEHVGVAPETARGMIEFRLAADADQFLTIAKFRALRKLWARVEQACGLSPRRIFIAAETAWRMTTRRDPYVNMLRATIAAFAAGAGGADAISVLPFTAALGLPDRFARRIARNTQLLLLEESHLAKVTDPAAGSGAMEDLTDRLCRTAWSLFQDIERAGGIQAALEQGLMQAKVEAVRTAREANVARRKDALTGTSDFPDLGEAPVAVLDATPVAVPDYAAAVSYPPLQPMRLAEPFERLRDASDRVLEATGERPKVFLANLGTLAEFTARATFAMNFFAAGGIEAVTNDGFASRDAMISAFRASRARIACLCASDAGYQREAADAARALAAAGCSHIYLAGRPKDESALAAAGIAAFIDAGCDALATLRGVHARLGIERGPDR